MGKSDFAIFCRRFIEHDFTEDDFMEPPDLYEHEHLI